PRGRGRSRPVDALPAREATWEAVEEMLRPTVSSGSAVRRARSRPGKTSGGSPRTAPRHANRRTPRLAMQDAWLGVERIDLVRELGVHLGALDLERGRQEAVRLGEVRRQDADLADRLGARDRLVRPRDRLVERLEHDGVLGRLLDRE